MHYKNGTEAKVGDAVVGTTYNTKGIVSGILVGITPGRESCNCRVALLKGPTTESMISSGAVPMSHLEGTQQLWLQPYVDYSACADLVRADEAYLSFTAPQAVASAAA
jgi:hypothetical protein